MYHSQTVSSISEFYELQHIPNLLMPRVEIWMLNQRSTLGLDRN